MTGSVFGAAMMVRGPFKTTTAPDVLGQGRRCFHPAAIVLRRLVGNACELAVMGRQHASAIGLRQPEQGVGIGLKGGERVGVQHQRHTRFRQGVDISAQPVANAETGTDDE